MFQVKGTGFILNWMMSLGFFKKIVVVKDVCSVFQQTLETKLAGMKHGRI